MGASSGGGEPGSGDGGQKEMSKVVPDMTVRKFWGGSGEAKDPLLDKSVYIWNVDLSKLGVDSRPIEPPPAPEKPPPSGFLSLSRAASLDSLDVDLSKELIQATDATLDIQVDAIRNGKPEKEEGGKKDQVKWRFAPTKKEQKQWVKEKKATTGGSERLITTAEQSKEFTAETRAEGLAKFEQLKTDLQLFTLAIGLGCFGSAYATYTPEVAVSYGIGLIGSLIYVRMLSNSVDAVGAQSTATAARGALGQPRLLVPVVLVMTFNRWNELLVPQFGAVSLQLIPMLVGFFTYKGATLVQTFREVLMPLTKKKPQDTGEIGS